MPVLMLVVAVVILAGVVVVASGRGGELAPEYPDYPPIDLGPVTAADVALLRPPSAAWGYNMRVTDEALETIARAVTERDIKISALQQQLDDLRGGTPPPREGRPPGAPPAAADSHDEGAGPSGPEWSFEDDSAAAGDPETTSPEPFAARPGDRPEQGQRDGPGDQQGDWPDDQHREGPDDQHREGPDDEHREEQAGQGARYGTGQPGVWAAPAQAPVWAGTGQHDVPLDGGEPTNPDLPRQSPVWGSAAQQEAGYDGGWELEAGPSPAGSASPAEDSSPVAYDSPAGAGHARPPWAEVRSPWEPIPPREPSPPREPGSHQQPGPPWEQGDTGAGPVAWDESHPTLVWGVQHQRAKASRLEQQDQATQPGQYAGEPADQSEPEPGQYGPVPDRRSDAAPYETADAADHEDARPPAHSEQDHD